jgi:hypothetical protein
MKNRNFSINIIFTLLFLIISALFLIYIFRDINCREYFVEEPYSWKYGEGHSCKGNLNTNTELINNKSKFREEKYNRYEDNTRYNKNNLLDTLNEYQKYCDIMNWNDLLAYRCLNISPLKFSEFLNKSEVNIANTFEAIYIYNEESLYSHLLSKIYYQKNKLNAKIIGPVYVCISQAPYLKYLNNHNNTNIIDKTLDARIDILNNRNPYYLENINSNGDQSFVTNTSSVDDRSRLEISSLYESAGTKTSISSLYCQILILYPLYDINMKLKESSKVKQNESIAKFLDIQINDFYTDNDLCNIRCNKSNQLNCGCLSFNENSIKTKSNSYFDDKTEYTKVNEELDLPSYKSRCIDHTINNMNGNFSMMYFVNPYADRYGDMDIIQEP